MYWVRELRSVRLKHFSMESDFGRARVVDQWADDKETIEIAIDMCPVDCIWFVKGELAALEHCMVAREKIRELWAEEGAVMVVRRGLG